MTPKKKIELLRLCEEATETPWEEVPQNGAGPIIAHRFGTGNQMQPTGLRLICHVLQRGNSLKQDRANAAFIAAARSAVSDLLAENEKQASEIAAFTAECGHLEAENERLTNSLAQANKDFAAVFAKLVVADGREAEKHELTAAQRTLINHARRAFDQPQVEEQTKQIDLAAFDRMKAENERLREALKPFGNKAHSYRNLADTDYISNHPGILTVGDLRRAAAALAGTPADDA